MMHLLNPTSDKLLYLSNLNKTLKHIERELMERVIACLKIGEQKLKAKDLFTLDYEVEVEVSYYLENQNEAHCRLRKNFQYDHVINEKIDGMLLASEKTNDCYRESYMPKLNEAYCYLLHDLIDHIRIGEEIYLIDRIWFDVIFTDQKGIKINKNGSCRMLENDNCGGFK